MAKGTQNSGWPGFFRVFTVLCAIMLLLAQRYLDLTVPGSGARQALHVYEGLTCWAVPALFMLWGMYALEEEGPQLTASLLGLVLPAFCLMVFWGAVYAVSAHILGGGTPSWSAVWSALLSAVHGNTHFHLWVLYPLIGLYLVHPVFHRFISSASQGEIRYFLLLCFLFASLLPLLALSPSFQTVALQLERLQVHLVMGWAGCYVGGWYLRHYTISRFAEYILYLLGLLSLALTTMTPTVSPFSPALLRQYTAPNVLLTAAAFCTLFRYVLGVSEERARRRTVSDLGSYAIGIYWIHQLWVILFQHFGLSPLSFIPPLSVPLFALVFFLLSLPFAWLIFHIPGIGPKLT